MRPFASLFCSHVSYTYISELVQKVSFQPIFNIQRKGYFRVFWRVLSLSFGDHHDPTGSKPCSSSTIAFFLFWHLTFEKFWSSLALIGFMKYKTGSLDAPKISHYSFSSSININVIRDWQILRGLSVAITRFILFWTLACSILDIHLSQNLQALGLSHSSYIHRLQTRTTLCSQHHYKSVKENLDMYAINMFSMLRNSTSRIQSHSLLDSRLRVSFTAPLGVPSYEKPL